MGTLMALGMTRGKLIQLFTLEGTLHSVLAALVGAIYGIPLLVYFATQGWAMPKMVDQFGYAIFFWKFRKTLNQSAVRVRLAGG
jgi:ABC-type lipoprotein release transport system permease subunit